MKHIHPAIQAFMEAVYPGNVELALASFNEVKALKDATAEILRLRAALDRASKGSARHDVTCNYPRGPLYGPGCICMVVNKHVFARLEAASVRYDWLRDWYHREGKRSEIDPDGHVAVRTLPEWEALLDAAIARETQKASPECESSPDGWHYWTGQGTSQGMCLHCKAAHRSNERIGKEHGISWYRGPVNGKGDPP